jgi:hypothetical protein
MARFASGPGLLEYGTEAGQVLGVHQSRQRLRHRLAGALQAVGLCRVPVGAQPIVWHIPLPEAQPEVAGRKVDVRMRAEHENYEPISRPRHSSGTSSRLKRCCTALNVATHG